MSVEQIRDIINSYNSFKYSEDSEPLETQRGKEEQKKPNKKVGINCAICLEKLKTGQMAKKLNCTHNFHSGCINNWLKYKL